MLAKISAVGFMVDSLLLVCLKLLQLFNSSRIRVKKANIKCWLKQNSLYPNYLELQLGGK
ncbi:Uncharacterised protein [Vibrio cholerae]|nr:Uncharacterised protein [Vibrio cholerae]